MGGSLVWPGGAIHEGALPLPRLEKRYSTARTCRSKYCDRVVDVGHLQNANELLSDCRVFISHKLGLRLESIRWKEDAELPDHPI